LYDKKLETKEKKLKFFANFACLACLTGRQAVRRASLREKSKAVAVKLTFSLLGALVVKIYWCLCALCVSAVNIFTHS
jgi:hypothetical protein